MDGLMFLHQSAPYVVASNPFVLRWKDFDCSQWAIDTDAAGMVQNEQHVVRRPHGWVIALNYWGRHLENR